MDDQRTAYVALAMTPGIGPMRMRTLLEACKTPLGAHSAPFAFLCTLPNFSRDVAQAVKESSLDTGRRVIEEAHRLGAHVLLPDDPGYPTILSPYPDAPPLLFTLGDLSLLDRPAAAIVGSRNHSSYGAEVCRTFADAFARAGGVVVSGMARGLDAIAHTAALDAGGGTIGVLGNGLGVIYPAANRALYGRVQSTGLLLTEFPPGERPNSGSFPRRNRVISGLSHVTIVIEAAEGSGALITAGAAADQGKEVLAVPGPITSPTSVGTNRLIRDGATPLVELIDLFDRYPKLAPNAVPGPRPDTREAPALRPLPDTLAEAERAVATLLNEHPTHVDDVALRAARPVHEVLATLCSLEIAGIVHQYPGRLFRRT